MKFNFLKKRFDRAGYFDRVYLNNLFLGRESLSGEGSTLNSTRIIQAEIIKIVKEFTINSILDLPCGDLNWMQMIFGSITAEYTGADISESVIKANKEKFPTKNFIQMDIYREVPKKYDLIFCRDLLVHMPLEEGLTSIKNFRQSGSKYLLTTTFSDRKNNLKLDYSKKIVQWRPLNLSLPPFNFPRPELLINEKCMEHNGRFSDKCLGLYDLSKLDFSDA